MKENETKKTSRSAYITGYMKEKYKDLKLHCKPEEFAEIEKFCQDLQISKQKFLISCALYTIKHDMWADIAEEIERRG